MSFGSFSDQTDSGVRMSGPMADINVTPMVDVMLVLLVIFMLAAPMLVPSIRLELPQTGAQPAPQPAASLHIAIDAQGKIFFEQQLTDPEMLERQLAAAARQPLSPEIQLRADKATRYETIAQVMAVAQKLGLGKIAFVTDPAGVQATSP